MKVLVHREQDPRGAGLRISVRQLADDNYRRQSERGLAVQYVRTREEFMGSLAPENRNYFEFQIGQVALHVTRRCESPNREPHINRVESS